jgi:D-serine deaminase-like pyridoxal phosphate-dependent protein
MNLRLQAYEIDDVDRIITPALIIYPELVDINIKATLKMLGNDPDRWRPHIKTAKLGAILSRLIEHRIVNFKCSTTLELLTACQTGAADVLLAYSVVAPMRSARSKLRKIFLARAYLSSSRRPSRRPPGGVRTSAFLWI